MNHLVNYPLHEYLNNKNVIDLYRYLRMQQPDIVINLPYEYYNLYDEFIQEAQAKDWDYYELMDAHSGSDILEVLEVRKNYMSLLYANNKKIFIQFGNWLYEKLTRKDMDMEDREYPSWVYLEYENIIKSNTWLLHFTTEKYAQAIMTNGFRYGMNNINKLGLTTHFDQEQKSKGGYNFAYTVDDAVEYSGHINYGDTNNVIMFKASGVRAWHDEDGEHQVIFDGLSATDKLWLRCERHYKNPEKYWFIDKLPKIKSGDLYDLVGWVQDNYVQYKRRLN